MKAPELLLPAGTLERMRAAFDFGADAVYAGQPRYSLRARNNDFSVEKLKIGIDEAKARGKKFFLTSNLLAHNDKIRTYLRDIEPIIEMKPDAIIMADPGLIMMVREKWPEQAIHLSVQANTTNYAAVRFWQSLGLERVILSRELGLEEIEKIRQECPDMELEVFVHGALCIAYSGRCLLSGYMNHRDSNQGTCTNACRWDYKTMPAETTDSGDVQLLQPLKDFNFAAAQENANQSFSSCGDLPRHPDADQIYLIEEANRPGELMPIMEDEHGTYIMNSKDLRAIEHIERLTKIGVDSLKIEGRTKSLYYVARTAQTYRRAIDDAVAGRPFNPALLAELEGLANRGYTDGFYQRHHTQAHQNYLHGHSIAKRSQFVGEVKSLREGWAEVDVKNHFEVGDQIEIIHPSGNKIVTLEAMRDEHQIAMSVAKGSHKPVWIPLEAQYGGALLAKILPAEGLSA